MNGTVSIKEAVSIGQVLDYFGKPHTKSRAACPIHNSSNPSSFSFSDQLFFCFVCQAKGDSIDLWQRLGSCDFKTAVDQMGSLAGIRPGRWERKTARTYYPENIDPVRLTRRQYLDYLESELKRVDAETGGLETSWLNLRVSTKDPAKQRKFWAIYDRALSKIFEDLDSRAVFLNWKINQTRKQVRGLK